MEIRGMSDVERLLKANPTARQLHDLWGNRRPIDDSETRKYAPYSAKELTRIPWLDDLSLAKRFTAQALEHEEFLLTINAAREALLDRTDVAEDDRNYRLRIRMDCAAALNRLGFITEARTEIEKYLDPEFQLSMGNRLKTDIFRQLGDILRNEWQTATAGTAQTGAALDALGFYNRALDVEPDRIEVLARAASTEFMLSKPGEPLWQKSQEKALRVVRIAEDLNSEVKRWQTTFAVATAQVVLGRTDEALSSFSELKSMGGIGTADLAEARHEAQFLADALGHPREFFKTAFPPLKFVMFTGHPESLPRESVDGLREALRVELTTMDARVALGGASAGMELLFADVLNQLGGTVHLILPWAREDFLKTRVLPFEPQGGAGLLWKPLFDAMLQNTATIRELGHYSAKGAQAALDFAAEAAAGIALNMARALRLDIQPVILGDTVSGAFEDLWAWRLGVEPVRIGTQPHSAPVANAWPRMPNRCERDTLHQEVKSMLFADIEGYSKLNEETIPTYIEIFLGRLGELVATSKHAPCGVNTWGDALYAVFDFACDAGMFSLELLQMIEESGPEWLAKGLYWESRSETGEVVQHPLNVRIGLHTGPVAMHFDPVVRRIGYTGANVSRAARIEPVAKPGQAYASEEFAAMAELYCGSYTGSEPGFLCQYAGSMALAKGYPGRYHVYRVVPKRVLTIETLAKAVHEAYCKEELVKGQTSKTNAALGPWDDLPEDLKNSNRAQVEDIPNKLRMIGLELAATNVPGPIEMRLTDEQIEQLAIREHDRWMAEREKSGWTYAPVRDNVRKHHPLMVEWDRLSESDKDKDRSAIRGLAELIEKAGFRVRRIA
jgi:class 3 adenylate cyclase